MGAVGVVSEYNPFHSGHKWHLQEIRHLLGENVPIVCVMSGSWVQRGECAITDKWARAAMALRGGADLILELPLPWAISSAEGFAKGSIATLLATGVVDRISFGSESGNAAALKQTAQVMETEDYRKFLRVELDTGVSFAVARQRAVERILGENAVDLRNPNDSLGVEYLRQGQGRLEVYPVLRQAVSHDSYSATNNFASATLIRECVRQGEFPEKSLWMNDKDRKALSVAGVARMDPIERAVLARLRQMTEADFSRLPDSGAEEGLCIRMVKASKQAGSLDEFYDLVKTKRYTHSRIRRLALWSFLGLAAEDRPEMPLYLRVLGFNERGRELLKEMKKTAKLPVLTKPTHIRSMDLSARGLFEKECKGTDLYNLCFCTPKQAGEDFIRSPIYDKILC